MNEQPQSPYEQHLFKTREDTIQHVMRGLDTVAPIDPAAMGKALELQRTKLPGASALEIAQDPELIAKREHDERVADILRKSPSMLKWLQVPTNAALSKNEIETLSRYDDAQLVHPKAAGVGESFTTGVEKGTLSVKQTVRGAQLGINVDRMVMVNDGLQTFMEVEQAMASSDPEAALERLYEGDNSGLVLAYSTMLRNDPAAAAAYKEQQVLDLIERSGASDELMRLIAGYQSEIQAMPDHADGAMGYVAGTVGEALPFLAAYIAAGVATGPAGVTAVGLGAGYGEITANAVTDGATTDDLKDEGFRARRALGSVAYAALDNLGAPGRYIRKGFGGVSPTLWRKAVETYGVRVGKEIAKTGFEEASAELLQGMVVDWAVNGEIEWTPEKIEQRLQEFIAGGTVGLVFGTVHAPFTQRAAGRRERDMLRGPSQAQAIENINSLVENTQLRTTSPEAYADFLQQAGFGTRSIHVDAKALTAMAGERPGVVSALGITEQQLQDANDRGGTVSVNMATYMSNVPGRDKELAKLVAEHGRLQHDAPSKVESEEYADTEGKERADEAVVAQATEAARTTARAEVTKQVRDKLVSIGMKPGAATKTAETHGAFLHSMAERYGDDAVFGMFDLDVGGPGAAPTTGRLLNQLPPEIDAEILAFNSELSPIDQSPGLSATQVATLQAGALPAGIDSGAFMFATADSQRVPLANIRPIRARPEGIANARPLMAKAALSGSRRQPLSVKLNDDGTYTLLDGNSTYAVLNELGVTDAPVRVFTDEEFLVEQAKDAARKALKNPGKKPRYVELAVMPTGTRKAVETLMAQRQPFDTLAEMIATAEQEQAEFNAAMREAVEAAGLTYTDAPAKKIDSAARKVNSKYSGDHHRLTDTVRAGFTAQSLPQVKQVLDALAAKYTLLDEGFHTSDVGYTDAKVLVVLPSGRVAELQIWPPKMLAAKNNPVGGHRDYEVSRDGKQPEEVRKAAEERQLENYGSVISELDETWGPALVDAARNEAIASFIPSMISKASTSVNALIRGSRMISATSTSQTSSPENAVPVEAPSSTRTMSASVSNQEATGQSPSEGAPSIEGEAADVNEPQFRLLKQSDVRRPIEETGQGTGVKLTMSLGKAAAVARDGKWRKGRDFKIHLQELVRAEHGTSLTKLSDENVDKIADFIIEDALEAVQDNQNAIGWYDDAVRRAKTEMAKLYPEIADGAEHELAFIWALAVTSNGLKVDKNFELAAKAYEVWRETGSFPKKIGVGTAAKSINTGLAMYAKLMKRLGSWEAVRDFMINEAEVRAIEKTGGIAISGEGKGTVIRGAGVLGPKIGNGFFSNLYGYFDGLTMDRWLMRSVGRWRGSLIDTKPAMQKKKREQLNELADLLSDADLQYITGFFNGTEIVYKRNMTDDELSAMAIETAKRSQVPGWRKRLSAAADGNGDLFRRLGNALAKYIDGQVEAPAGAAERVFLRKAFSKALETLQQQPGMEQLTMADLQALLWYPEKLLYASAKKKAGEELKSYVDDEAPDYGNAARNLVAARLGQDGGSGGLERGPDGSGSGDAESAGQGQADRTLNQKPGDTGPRGVIRIPGAGVAAGTTVIELNYKADLSTFLHESGHFFLEAFQHLASQPNAPQAMKDDLAKIYEWVGKTDDGPFTTAQHEQWAEGFEKYLMEGVAPSPTLKAAFASFARWLTYLYKAAVNIGRTPINDDIREVMARMLATDEELQTMKAELDAGPLFTEVPPGMSNEEFEIYKRVAERADAEAQGRMLERAMAKIRRRRTNEYKARLKVVTEEIREEVAERREHQLIQGLGGRLEGVDVRLDKAELVEKFGAGILADLQSSRHGVARNLYGEGGVSLAAVAEHFGYRNESEMVDAVRGTAPLDDVVANEAKAQVDAEMGEELSEASIRDEAEASIKNPYRQEQVAREIEGIRRAIGGKPTRWQLQNQKAAAKAEQAVGRMSVREVMGYQQFLVLSRRHARAAQRALAGVIRSAEGLTGKSKEALLEAAAAKQRQLEADHMYRIARERAMTIEAARKRFARLGRQSTQKAIGPMFMDAVDAILNKFDLRVRGPKEVKQDINLMEFHQQLMASASAIGIAFDPKAIIDMTRRHYTVLSSDEMLAVIDTVDNIIHMGRGATKLEMNDKVFDLKMVLGDIRDRVLANLRGDPPARSLGERKKNGWLVGIRHALINADTMLEEIDHGQSKKPTLGPAYTAIKLEIDRAHDRLDKRRQKVASEITKLYRDHLGGPKGMSKLQRQRKIYPTLNGDTLSKMDLIMLALNTGNEGNYSRIEYEGGALADVLLRELTEADWRFIQNTWDYLDSFWPEIDAKYRKVTGLRSKKVEHRVMIPGAPEFVTGGYFPIRYDKDLSSSTETQDRASLLLEGKSGSFLKAQTARGHTQQRLDKVTNKRLLLDPSIIENHVFNVIHDLELGEPVANAGKIIYGEDFKAMLNERGRGGDTEFYKAWLEDVAIGEHRLMAHVGAKVIRWMRGSVSAQALGFNMSTSMLQFTGIANSFVELGTRPMLMGMLKAIGGGGRQVRDASPFMQERIRTFNTDMNELMNTSTRLSPTSGRTREMMAMGLTRVQQRLLPLAMVVLQQMQFRLVDTPTWLAAYDKAVRAGNSMADAAAFADNRVRVLQGSGRVTDRSAIERGRLGNNIEPNAVVTMTTMLYSYMNAKLNRQYLMMRGAAKGAARKDWRLLGSMVASMIMYAFLDEAMYSLTKGGIPEDEEEWRSYFLGLAMSPLNMFPGARELTGYFRYGSVKGPFSSAIESFGKAGQAAYDVVTGDEDLDENWADFAEGVVTTLGLPLTQVIKQLETFFDKDLSEEERQEIMIRRTFGGIGNNIAETLQ